MNKFHPVVGVSSDGKDIEVELWLNAEGKKPEPIFQTGCRAYDLQDFGTAFAELNRQLQVIWEHSQMQDSGYDDVNAGEVFDENPF